MPTHEIQASDIKAGKHYVDTGNPMKFTCGPIGGEMDAPCPECTPHHVKWGIPVGMVCLLTTWVPCLTCNLFAKYGYCGCGYPHNWPVHDWSYNGTPPCHRCAAQQECCGLCGEDSPISPCDLCTSKHKLNERARISAEQAKAWTPADGIQL